MVRRADIAEFYGISPAGLSEFEVEGLLQNIRRLAAKRKREWLERHPQVEISPDAMLALIHDETGDEELAQEIASQYAESLLKARGEAD